MDNLKKVVNLKASLDALRPLSVEDEQRVMQKFRLDWNYHSNHLEGNSLTYGETKALILFGITAQGKPLKDHFELTGHNEAIHYVLDVIKEERPLTENFIRELHKIILKESYEADAITPDGKPTKKTIRIGDYKQSPNHVRTRTGEIFRFATPEETPAKMKDLLDWYRKRMELKDVDPVLIASQFHYDFIRIHPFDDGNGRTARILMNFILMQFGFPPVIIKTEEKEDYFAVLGQADAGIFEPFVDFVAKNLVRSLEIMIKGAQGEDIEEVDDFDKEMLLLDQKLKGMGERIEVLKSEEALSDLFESSMAPLIIRSAFFNEKFSRYYLDTFTVLRDNNSMGPKINFNDLNAIARVTKKFLASSPSWLEFIFSFKDFNRSEAKQFDFIYVVKFVFGKTRYQIEDSSENVILEKLYNSPLTKEEIDDFFKKEARLHKEHIERQTGMA